MSWYKKAQTDEMKDHYIKRTEMHISYVQDNVKKIVDEFPEYSELLERVKDHDKSKFEEPEFTPYISLTWRKKPGVEGDFEGMSTKEEETEATLHHILNNSHHPEYHLENKEDANIDPKDRDKSKKCVDASAMPDLDIVEMIADWQAMSDELKTNTAREWYDEQKNVRWEFSDHQDKLISKILEVFE